MNLIISRPTKESFKLWHYYNQRSYDLNSEVGLQKYKIFKDNVKYINLMNSQNNGYKLGLGPFTDMSFEEFSKIYLNEINPADFIANTDLTPKNNEKENSISFDELADEDDDEPFVKRTLIQQDNSIDQWGRKIIKSKDHRNSLYPAKDQGVCGSCWAFAAVGTVEAQLSMKYGGASGYNLSEQHLLDCQTASRGCDGAFTPNSFTFMVSNGLRSGNEYKYTARKNFICQQNKYKVIAKVGGYRFCQNYSGNPRYYCNYQIIKGFLDVAPVANDIHANRSFVHYQQGQWYPDRCTTTNHSVVTVYMEYYEEKKGLSVNDERMPESKWRIRNSWGKGWGENGQADVIAYPNNGPRACFLGDMALLPENVTLVQ